MERWRTVVYKSCRSRGVDTVEIPRPSKYPKTVATRRPAAHGGPAGHGGQALGEEPGPSRITHHSFLGSFSAVSKRNFATKYAFFQVFRDLQNYLADFLKKLQILPKIAKFCKIFANFPDFCKKNVDFVKIADFLQNFAKFLKI